MHTRPLVGIVLFLSALALLSCGGGSSGGGNIPPTPTPAAADFQLVVASPGVTAQQGGAQQSQTVQVNPLNGFTGTVSVTLSGLPTGVAASPSGPFSITVTGLGAATAFQLTASRTSLPGATTVTLTGTSGTITHTVTFSLTVRQAAPFAIQVSRSSVSLAPASSATVQVSVTANPGISPQLNLNVSGAPNGSQIFISSPQGILTLTNPLTFSILATVLAQPLQNFPVMVVASDNANNTSLETVLLTVTVPPPNTTPTRSTFFRTDQSPTGMVYDQSRKLLFVSVEILNEVVVLSTVDGHEVASIPVSFPAGIDEAADGSAVYVVSPLVGGVAIIDPNLLQVIGHSSVPSSVSGLTKAVTFFQVAALSNGKVLFYPTFDVVDLTKPPFFLWDPTADTFTRFGPQNLSANVGLISRSADHSKVLAHSGVFNGGFLYDVTTDSFIGPNSAITGFPAIKPDGSQIAATLFQNSSFLLGFYDSNFNLLASLPIEEFSLTTGAPRPFYSLDGKFLYLVPDQQIGTGSPGPVATVIDTTTFAVIGVVPAFTFDATLPFGGQWITTFALDETGMVFGATFGGVGFLDMTSTTFLKEPLPGPFSVQPSLASLTSSTQAQLDGVGFSQGLPLGLFLGAPPASPQSLAATNISVQDNNFVNLSIPHGVTAGAANTTLTRSDGFFEVRPDAVSFGPTILRIDADAGSPSGGDSIKIIGYGLSRPNTQVSIGGRLATISQQAGGIPGQLFPTERILLKTPPGVAGMADVTVSTPSGSTTVAGGFQYLNTVQVHPMSGILDAIVYDKTRQRLYVTNQDHNRVEIFDLGTNTFLSPVAVGSQPTALTLTPDSNLLAVINRGDGTVSVINTATMQVTATYSALTSADKQIGCGGEVLNITSAAPHRALVDIGCTSLAFNGLFHLINLDTGSLDCTGVAGCSANGTDIVFGVGLAGLASSSDGTKIFLATTTGGGSPLPVGVLDLTANTLTSGFSADFDDAAISADGTIFAGNFAVLNASAELKGFMAYEPYADTENVSLHNVFGEKLNPSGSLLFYPQDSGVDIFDTHTGRLVRHIVLADPIPADSGGMALDETGMKMFLISNTGITIAQLFQAPLGLATVNPAAGPQGTVVVIRGSGYQNGATVTFGTTQVSATFVDSNTLHATVPALPPGAVRISVKNPDGHQYSLDDAYTVN
jgi:YVTN family beta-propeller protein